jgi:serine/threonine protein phosphatase PrpC
MRAIAVGLTDVGLQREHNEDSFVVLKEFDLFVVADGMGGHRAGDVASKLATETISEFFRSTANEDVTWPFHFDTNLSEEENRLLTGIRVANRQIFERSTRSREFHGMGTTVVGAMYSPRKNRMYIGHVGDSRCYRVRDGKIQLLTRDHSLFNDYVLAMPDLTEEQRRELPKNVITRALGMQDQVMVDLQHDESKPGDTYVLCSDGLSGMIQDDEIERIVAASTDIREACRKLIEIANDHGGEDNITAVLIRIEDENAQERAGAATEAPPAPSSTLVADVPPVKIKPQAAPNVGYDDPTHPALDLRKELAEMKRNADVGGDDPTHPALNLSKELADLRKLGEDPTLPAADLRKAIADAQKLSASEEATKPEVNLKKEVGDLKKNDD